jgi:hypothetical protein
VNGAYRIESANQGLPVRPRRPGEPGSAVIIWERIGGPFPDPDLWTFEPSPEPAGAYYIVNAEVALVIGIETPVAAGAGLQLEERKREPGQLWRFEAVPNQPGSYYIASAATGLVIGAPQPLVPGTQLHAVQRTLDAAHWWTVLTSAGAPAQPPDVQAAAG